MTLASFNLFKWYEIVEGALCVCFTISLNLAPYFLLIKNCIICMEVLFEIHSMAFQSLLFTYVG